MRFFAVGVRRQERPGLGCTRNKDRQGPLSRYVCSCMFLACLCMALSRLFGGQFPVFISHFPIGTALRKEEKEEKKVKSTTVEALVAIFWDNFTFCTQIEDGRRSDPKSTQDCQEHEDHPRRPKKTQGHQGNPSTPRKRPRRERASLFWAVSTTSFRSLVCGTSSFYSVMLSLLDFFDGCHEKGLLL